MSSIKDADIGRQVWQPYSAAKMKLNVTRFILIFAIKGDFDLTEVHRTRRVEANC
jgi:hypothetical protein